jgi:hypothetical protein
VNPNIPLRKGEVLLTFKNKINGIIYFSTNRYKPVIHEGQEMLPVFQRAAPPNARHLLLVSKAALERVFPASQEAAGRTHGKHPRQPYRGGPDTLKTAPRAS